MWTGFRGAGQEVFAELAQWVAFDRYSNCPSDNAEDEQETVMDAFTAVGYGLPYDYYECEDKEDLDQPASKAYDRCSA